MSYCRWSSDGWQSDIYCYECTDGGYVAHVAAARRPRPVPASRIDFRVASPAEMLEARRWELAQLDDPANAPVPIGLPYDGETFTADDPDVMLEILLMLRREGYHIPESAVEALREEAGG